MIEMNLKIDHIAIASNSIEDSDKFFVDLLGLNKTRTFSVNADLMKEFFGVNKEHSFIRYENNNMAVEVVINKKRSKANDIFTHSCLIVDDNVEEFINKAKSMGFKTVKVARKEKEGYYYFINDFYNNLYEIKK